MSFRQNISDTFSMDNSEIQHPIIKAVVPVAFALLGHSVGEWASLLACIISLLMIFEWLYKRVYRPLALRFGWITLPNFVFSTSRVSEE